MPASDQPITPTVGYIATAFTLADWNVITAAGVTAGVLVTFQFGTVDIPVILTRDGAVELRDALDEHFTPT